MLKAINRFVAMIAVAILACALPADSQLPIATDADVPPSLTDGIYIGYGACPGEGCSIAGHIRATSDGTLVDGPVSGAAVIGVIKAREWVEVLDTQERLVPVRGVLRREAQGLDGLKPGDVVYMLGYEGEGCSTLYRRGQDYSWCDQGLPEDSDEREIEWDFTEPPQDLVDRTGFFIQVRRADGQEGWLGAGGDFQCVGAIDATRDCPWFNNAEEAAAWSPPNDIDQYWGHEGRGPNPWLYDGLYSERVFCPGQDCYLGGSIRAKESVGLVGGGRAGCSRRGHAPGRRVGLDPRLGTPRRRHAGGGACGARRPQGGRSCLFAQPPDARLRRHLPRLLSEDAHVCRSWRSARRGRDRLGRA
jgi:hypothetical protein